MNLPKVRSRLLVLLANLFFLISFTNSLAVDPDEMAVEKQIAVAYVAKREQIPPKRLQVVDIFWQETPDLNRRYLAITLLDEAGGRQFHKVLVDPVEKRALEIAEVEAAHNRLRQAKYGKLRPALHERLQTAVPDEAIEIGVWLTGPDRTILLDQLMNRYPEARTADEPERWLYEQIRLNKQISAAYERLEQRALLARQAPLAKKLQAEGYEVVTYSSLPSLTTRVPPAVIREIAQRQEVAAIYLLENKASTFLASALSSNRGDLVQQKGVKGQSILVGVLEKGLVEDNEYIEVSEVEQSFYIPDSHPTAVASVIVSSHPTLRGMVPEAAVATASLLEEEPMPEKLAWFHSKGVRIINHSAGFAEATDEIQWIDRVVDYYVRRRHITYVAAIGNYNFGNHIASPAKAYNVISVGGIVDKNNANWSDDEMWGIGLIGSTSPWQDPQMDNDDYGDREKPEVVASAENLDLIELDGRVINSSGTSFAAPQVAGLAAMLVQQDDNLRVWPEGIKAVIMASAIHNIEGESRISEKDGVGAIDAAQAAKIMQQTTYAARGIYYNGRSSDSWRDDDYLQQEWSFEVKEGDRVRAVIAWASTPDESFAPGTDTLDTNLDLVLVNPFNNTAAYSASRDNNYEIVDFVATVTGAYKILVYRDPDNSTESLNSLGIA